MPVATILFSWFGCTQMEDPGEPFAPVLLANSTIEESKDLVPQEKPEETEKKESNTEKETPKTDPLFQTSGEVLITSGEKKEEQENKDITVAVVAENEAELLSEKNIAEQENEKEEVKADNPDSKSEEPTAFSVIHDWPLRVVKTEAQLNPPRAILGFPNGDEVVVQPGMLLSEQGLVIMSIGKKAVVLAKIVANGDHANIESITVPSLND